MLVLRRAVGQYLRIATPAGDDIWIKVVRAKDRTMRLAISAPDAFSIERYGGNHEPAAPALPE